MGLLSRVVVINDYIGWAVGETPKVKRDLRHQGHCETVARGQGARSQECGYGRMRIDWY